MITAIFFILIFMITTLTYFSFSHCIVLMGWSLLPNELRPFWDLLCSPNLDTRTRICRLNFAQGPMFSGLRFSMNLKSETRDPQLKVPPGGLVLGIFPSWKSPSTSIEASTLPRDRRGRLCHGVRYESNFCYLECCHRLKVRYVSLLHSNDDFLT